jgi:hypothetical protein
MNGRDERALRAWAPGGSHSTGRGVGDHAREGDVPGAHEPDRAIGLDEAARILGMERRTLERKPMWQRLAGYKDVDGRVKFRVVDLHRHIRRRSGNGA